MKISTKPTCPGHKRNQGSLNENQAVCLMRTLIYFIFPLYFILVSLDAVNQQVFIECILGAQHGAKRSGEIQIVYSSGEQCDFLTSSGKAGIRITWELVRNANDQSHLRLTDSESLGMSLAFGDFNKPCSDSENHWHVAWFGSHENIQQQQTKWSWKV